MRKPENNYIEKCIKPACSDFQLLFYKIHGGQFMSGLPDLQLRTKRGKPVVLEIEVKYTVKELLTVQSMLNLLPANSLQRANLVKFAVWGHNVFLLVGSEGTPVKPKFHIIFNAKDISLFIQATKPTAIPSSCIFPTAQQAISSALTFARSRLYD